MKRNHFIYLSASGTLSLFLPFYACKNNQNKDFKPVLSQSDFEQKVLNLLTVWCDAMIRDQIVAPEEIETHGALYCHACEKIHGRCMDAVYPFMYMADQTGEQKYLDAAINVMKWSENVSMPDGSWTVIPDQNSWKGITVFGAIALGEALYHHGHVLTPDIKESWTLRLEKSADFIFKNFTIEYSHINYAFTAIYALNFLGRFFENQEYIDRSKVLANEIPKWLTEPNKLLFGEDKPANEPSAKGLMPIDLGYNVEETLNGVVQYAVLEKDEELLQILTNSLKGHLEFMLPDGGWDNSWGTRQNKWTYWGSRTCDGSQPAFTLLADRNPAFATSVVLHTELLEKCTVNGLLAGGLHYKTHGVKPCIHHTFAHAKNLAFLLNHPEKTRKLTKNSPIPRAISNGVKHFPELDVWLAAKGPWRATVSSYDQVYKIKYSYAATGGALAVLWHELVGPVFTASMAEFILVEVNNQQEQPDGEDIPLTPRIECRKNGKLFSNIFDLEAEVKAITKKNELRFEINTQLTNRDHEKSGGMYQLNYLLNKDAAIIKAKKPFGQEDGRLVLPIISATGEKVLHIKPNRIEIVKEKGIITLETNVPIAIMNTKKDRVFNMVPGFEAIPIYVEFSSEEIICKITVDKNPS
ncbi:hypothetical protein [Namhaeicola litoreus]|uniref:Uncharacterized protein n=1 Tax=Namhaeicola litoreus TaxID=1052145 RepID=A0ABW3Y697_9FLAO